MDIHALINAQQGKTQKTRMNFWRPKVDGVTPLRLYRFGPEKELYENRVIHWVNSKPQDCLGDDCPLCDAVRKLYDAGDEDSKQRANSMRKQTLFCFVAVNPNKPDEVLIWEPNYGVGRDVILAIAQVAGWVEGWPKPEQQEKVTEFLTFFGRGMDEVCGPNGYDLLVNYEKNRKPSVTVSFGRIKGKALSMPEPIQDAPSAVRGRIAENRRKQESKERGVFVNPADAQV